MINGCNQWYNKRARRVVLERVIDMATKSILKNINIKQRKHLKRFADALDKAEKSRGKYVSMSRGVVEAKGEEIKRLFQINR